mgnify:CR=1 FL=1
MKRAIVAFGVLAAGAPPAYAHSPFPGIGDFYNGMLHPLIVPAHVLAIVGLGLMLGQKAPSSSRLAVPAFAIALVVSLATPPSLVSPPPQAVLLGIVLVAGLLIAFSVNLGIIIPAVIAAVVGILIGLDARQSASLEGQSWITLAGAWLGSMIAVVLLAGLSSGLVRLWHGIAVRVLGSWIAASTFLVIALSFASPTDRG